MARPTKAELRHRANDRRLWKAVVAAAQATYHKWEEYGVSDDDMEKAIRAAFAEWNRHPEKLPTKAPTAPQIDP